MRPAPVFPDEELRLRTLHDLQVLDCDPEPDLDALVRAAALACQVPVSLISLVDSDRQWFAARHGMADTRETPRSLSFCAHAIGSDEILEVPDTRRDERFADHPDVVGHKGLRFYAGAPLLMSNGTRVGTLCVVDTQPHELDATQREILQQLARAAARALEGRRAMLEERRLREEALRARQELTSSEARYRALSAASPLGVFMTDADGSCIYTNSRWREIYGLSLADSLGDGWSRVLHEEDRLAVFQEWQRCAAQQIEFDMQFRVRRPDGDVRHLHSRARAVFADDGEVSSYVGTVEDITDSKQVEQALLDERLHMKSVLEGTGAGTWEWNVATGQARFNEQWALMLGYSLQELEPATIERWIDLMHPDDLQRAQKRLDQHFRGEHPFFECEFRMRHRSGHWVWLLSRGRVLSRLPDGKPQWMFGTHLDINERKLQEQAMRKSEQLLRRVGQVAGVGGWVVELPQKELWWSEETCRIHGVPPDCQPSLDEALGFFAGDARLQMEAALAHALDQGQGWDLQLPLTQRDGRILWVRTVGDVELDNGRPLRLIGAFQDISEHMQQRRQLAQANERMALAADSGGIAVWELDLLSSAMVWDGWMYRLFGLDNEQPAQNLDSWLQCVHADDRAAAQGALQRAVRARRSFDTEFRVLLPGGGVRHVRAAGRMVQAGEGEPTRMVGVCWDVSHLRELSVQLARQHELMRVTLQCIGDAVITTDADGAVSWVNLQAEHLTGWSNEEAVGRPAAEILRLVDEQTREPLECPVQACLSQGRAPGQLENAILLSRAGREYGIEDSVAPIRTEAGELLGAVVVFHDVTEQRRQRGEISWRASHDALTGLVNRSEFGHRLQRALDSARQEHCAHALLFIDLDRFKQVNDNCGHAAGDLLLQQVSRLLGECIRAGDTLARLGGDEFAVLLDRCPAEQAERVAAKMCQRVQDYGFVHDEQIYHIGASIGLAPLDERWETLEDAVAAADSSCYAAKQSGRNQVHRWQADEAMPPARTLERHVQALLEQALQGQGFELYAQRVQALAPGARGLHAEVLLRLRDSDGQLLLPASFMPVVERAHLSARVDRWVVRRVIEWLAAQPDLADVSTLSLNISAQSAADRAFHRQVAELLATAGRELCARLCFEVGELAAVSNPVDVRAFIELSRGLGVRIALDDFGSGATSFGYLRSVAVDVLKIDGQFVRDLIDNPLDAAALRCFVDVAAVVGVSTVAKLVERPEVLEQLRQAGVDLVQGTQIHLPQPLGQLLAPDH